MIRKYLIDLIDDHKTKKLRVYSRNEAFDYENQFEEWEIHLIMPINFLSKDSDVTRIMLTKSDNIESIPGSEKDDNIEELFNSLLQKYQEGLEESMKVSRFIFNSIGLLYHYLQKTSLSRKGPSYINSPKWFKSKKATINPKKLQ